MMEDFIITRRRWGWGRRMWVLGYWGPFMLYWPYPYMGGPEVSCRFGENVGDQVDFRFALAAYCPGGSNNTISILSKGRNFSFPLSFITQSKIQLSNTSHLHRSKIQPNSAFFHSNAVSHSINSQSERSVNFSEQKNYQHKLNF